MRYWLTIALFLLAAPALAQSDAGLDDVNSLPTFEPTQWDRDAGEPDWDSLVRKESGHFCGDGRVNNGGAERCDGRDLNGETCESLGYVGGTLGCEEWLCVFDTSGCLGAVCGDGRVDEGEECDQRDLTHCDYDEPAVNVCVDCQWQPCIVQHCGDGRVQARFERCDPGPDADRTFDCTSRTFGEGPGHPTPGAVCLDDCSVQCDYCGDGDLQVEFEECEFGMTSPTVCRERFGAEADAICVACQWHTTPCERALESQAVSGDQDASNADTTSDSEVVTLSGSINSGCSTSPARASPLDVGVLLTLICLLRRSRKPASRSQGEGVRTTFTVCLELTRCAPVSEASGRRR